MIFVLKEKVCKKAENYLKVTNGIISVEDSDRKHTLQNNQNYMLSSIKHH